MLLPGRTLPLGPGTFRALRHRDFRLLWLGQLVSLTGGWMQSAAQGWLVLRLTDSALYLGVVGFCNFAPILVGSLPAGVVADRLDPRRTLLALNALATLNASALAVLTATGRINLPAVALIALIGGSVSAFEIPVRQKFLLDLVGRDDLANAIALNSLAFNGARLIGPSVAGVVLAAAGEAACFAANAASFGAVLLGLFALRTRPDRSAHGEESWTAGIRRGLAYARGSRRVRVLLALVIVSGLFGLPYNVLLPVFARDVLKVGESGLGFLMGASGLGAVIGALYLAGRTSHRRSGPVVATAIALFGLGLIGLGLSRSFALSLACLTVVGFAMIVQMATSNTLLQLNAPPEMRGRVVSLYLMAFAGSAPFGALFGGALARAIGAPAAVIAGGTVCLAAAIWLFTRIPEMRRSAAAADETPR